MNMCIDFVWNSWIWTKIRSLFYVFATLSLSLINFAGFMFQLLEASVRWLWISVRSENRQHCKINPKHLKFIFHGTILKDHQMNRRIDRWSDFTWYRKIRRTDSIWCEIYHIHLALKYRFDSKLYELLKGDFQRVTYLMRIAKHVNNSSPPGNTAYLYVIIIILLLCFCTVNEY